jgi:hypothetical protein
LGYAGSTLAEEDGQEAAADGEADALGLRGSGERGLLVLAEDDGLVEAALHVSAAGLQLVELLAEAEGFLAVAFAVEVVAYGVGLAVDGLSAGAALLGQSGDVAVATEEGSRSAGETIQDG